MTLLSKNARVAGFLYIVGSLVAVVRLIYIPNTLIVSENATATVNNIARHELLFRFGIVSQLLTGTLWIFDGNSHNSIETSVCSLRVAGPSISQ